MILAVKGLGGFHLICDPLRPASLGRLRKIKERERKPLALMAFDLRAVAEYAHLSPAEKNELASAQRPIVLLRKKKDIPGIAPGLNEIGFMLPYTPLHYLLLEQCRLVVATSSNRKDAPIIKDEKEGISGLCDYRLTHDRPIHMRSDDSVLKVVAGRPLFLRRGRGFVPHPQKVPRELLSPHHVLALGAELKDTVSIYKNGYVVTSQFLGDLDDYQNFRYFKETLSHLLGLFDIRPQAVVSDLHPHFHTTRFARKLGPPHFQVQHHFAHCLAPLLEHQVPPGKKVLGVALDGYGYGEDGLAWGGEFLIVDYTSYERFAHFQYVPLPGGDRAAKQPWRMALSYLYKCFGPDWPRVPSLAKINPKNRNAILEMLRKDIRSPLTSSCGRLFDAVSFLLGLSPQEVEFEAEAAIRLEAAALPKIRGSYRFAFLGEGHPYSISFRPMIRDILKDLTAGVTSGIISARFHNTLGSVIAAVAEKARREFATDTVVFVGGCFLNKVLLAQASKLCQRKGLTVLRSVRYSPNDESISLGQIAHALARLKKDES
jgi:hydrogenase maturation protein HypF